MENIEMDETLSLVWMAISFLCTVHDSVYRATQEGGDVFLYDN